MIVGFKLKSLIYFVVFFVFGIIYWSNIIVLHVAVQFPAPFFKETFVMN